MTNWISAKKKPFPTDRYIFIQIEIGNLIWTGVSLIEKGEHYHYIHLNCSDEIEKNMEFEYKNEYEDGDFQYTPNIIKYWQEIEVPDPILNNEPIKNKKTTGWISIKDELPPVNKESICLSSEGDISTYSENVFCLMNIGNVVRGRFHTQKIGNYGYNLWETPQRIKIEGVTHWIPLPDNLEK